MEISCIYYVVMLFIFLVILIINIPKVKNAIKSESFPIEFITTMFSIVGAFFLSLVLTINIYNSQNKNEVITEQNKIMEYLEFIDENLNEVDSTKLEIRVSVGYINYDYFDNLRSIGDELQNKKYFKLIGYLKQMKNLFYSVHNANLIDPKNNPIRPDQAELINKTINLIKSEIKAIKNLKK